MSYQPTPEDRFTFRLITYIAVVVAAMVQIGWLALKARKRYYRR